ncbi:MAG: LamG domain-containing protein, partial [Bacteroidetes bacterium]|nr:LamG domain-containing protein [Bacteroidota bacterium]
MLFFGPGGGSTNAYGTKVLDTNWHMVTATYSNSLSQIKFYVDGVLDNTTSGVSSPNSAITQSLYFGRDSYSSAYFLDGSLEEVRIYSKALDTASIHGLYNAPNPAGLVAYWSFDGNAIDYTGNGHNG